MDMADNTFGDMLLGFGGLLLFAGIFCGGLGRSFAMIGARTQEEKDEINGTFLLGLTPGALVIVLGLLHWAWWMFRRGYVW